MDVEYPSDNNYNYNHMDEEYYINNNYNHMDDDYSNKNNYIGIPIMTPNTFYSDFICQNTNYINITNDINNKNIVFNKIIKSNKTYYVNTINGTLYTGSNINSLIKLPFDNVFIFDISNNGNYLVYSVDNVVNVYNFKTNQHTKLDKIQQNIYNNEKNKYIKQIMFTPDNSRLIFSQNEHIYIWNIKNNQLDDKIETDVINFTANNNYIFISNYDKFSIYDINNRTTIYNKTFENNIIKIMKIINDTLIIGFINGLICMININNNYNYNETFFKNNFSGIKDIAFSDDNNYMASVDTDNILSVFNIKTKQHVFSLNGFHVSSIYLTNNLNIIGSGHNCSFSHFISPFNFK